ncbi:hypothetical protein [Streptomyces boninensis]|uniref:hypothetical protein n=1 Tax=Streptomyces boninensis TaxID=2039455 RepID=UPI003B2145EC
MRATTVRRTALPAAALAVATLALTAWDRSEATEAPADTATTTGYGHPPAKTESRQVVKLADGRKVAMGYKPREGLLEQHTSKSAKGWSAPKLLYRTKTDHCQSLTLKAFGRTVAASANWALYCADGEPPNESIAAVGTGSFAKWDTHFTPSFDGWEKIRSANAGRTVDFTNASVETLTRLRWQKGTGFGDVEEIPR